MLGLLHLRVCRKLVYAILSAAIALQNDNCLPTFAHDLLLEPQRRSQESDY